MGELTQTKSLKRWPCRSFSRKGTVFFNTLSLQGKTREGDVYENILNVWFNVQIRKMCWHIKYRVRDLFCFDVAMLICVKEIYRSVGLEKKSFSG